jgi:hypothetical protein
MSGPICKWIPSVFLVHKLSLFSPELDVQFHMYQKYAPVDPMTAVIPFHAIYCHIARGTLTHTTPPQWITTTLDKVRAPFALLLNHSIDTHLQMSPTLT